jgi:hypothetical protein
MAFDDPPSLILMIIRIKRPRNLAPGLTRSRSIVRRLAALGQFHKMPGGNVGDINVVG